MENASQPPVSHEIATWKETILGVLPVLTPFLVFFPARAGFRSIKFSGTVNFANYWHPCGREK
jgi:hypothetical protein